MEKKSKYSKNPKNRTYVDLHVDILVLIYIGNINLYTRYIYFILLPINR